MPILDGRGQERQGILEIANLMVVAARTAPKSGGRNDILTAVVTGPEAEALAADMEKIAIVRSILPGLSMPGSLCAQTSSFLSG